MTPHTVSLAKEHGWTGGEDDEGLWLEHSEHKYRWRSVPQTSTANRKDRRRVGIRTPLRDLEEYKRMRDTLDTQDEREGVGA